MSFVLSCAKNPSYTFREGEGQKMVSSENFSKDQTFEEQLQDDTSISSMFSNKQKNKMLVSIGSGVSMIKVNPVTGKFERVSGTMIGGGTLVGLSNLLTGISDFD
jgi:pantothenate kinase